MQKIKIMGERSTGTHLLESILKKNFVCELFPNSSGVLTGQRNALPGYFEGRWASRRATKEAIQDHNHFAELPYNGGWKHAAITERFVEDFARQNSAVVICLVRHPSEWLRSLHRNAFHGIGHVPKNFATFIRSPWIASARDELIERYLPTPLELLSRKTESYAYLLDRYGESFIIRYEDLVADPRAALSQVPIWDSQIGESVDLPDKSARSFGRSNLDTTGYVKKARASSFEILDKEDRKFVLNNLAEGKIAKLYPE